ncbi:MAG: glycosyltransferase family 9 protein [Alphaproteobacteria bacterium]|nr:glycosyltransferase family 9 protein [Alphaproteobacteria bacterium]
MASEQIMVIKHGALGDMVQAIDGFASLRAGHPKARLILLTTAPFAGLARAMPFFDEVLVDRRAKPWNVKDLLAMRRLFRSGLSRIYDFQSSRRTRRYFRHLVPAGVEFVGVPKGASHVLADMTGVNNRDRMVRTAVLGGCPEVTAEVNWLDGDGNNWPANAAVLIPGCSPAKPAKRWPAERFIALAQSLEASGLTPVLAGTAVDRDAGDVIMNAVPEAIDLIGKTSLMELASLLKSARLVVGNDTGPVFLGARLGAPTIMVMSRHTDPTMSAPYGPCAGWIKRDDIAAISAEMVMDEAALLMGKP